MNFHAKRCKAGSNCLQQSGFFLARDDLILASAAVLFFVVFRGKLIAKFGQCNWPFQNFRFGNKYGKKGTLGKCTSFLSPT